MVHVVTLATGATRTLGEVGDQVRALRFAPDGVHLASSTGPVITLWDLAAGTSRTLTGHTGNIRDLAFSADGQRLASAGSEGAIRLWDAASGAPQGVLLGHRGAIKSLIFTPDGVASASDDDTVRYWPLTRRVVPDDPAALRAWLDVATNLEAGGEPTPAPGSSHQAGSSR
jgi:WD40 repeat protein